MPILRVSDELYAVPEIMDCMKDYFDSMDELPKDMVDSHVFRVQKEGMDTEDYPITLYMNRVDGKVVVTNCLD